MGNRCSQLVLHLSRYTYHSSQLCQGQLASYLLPRSSRQSRVQCAAGVPLSGIFQGRGGFFKQGHFGKHFIYKTDKLCRGKFWSSSSSLDQGTFLFSNRGGKVSPPRSPLLCLYGIPVSSYQFFLVTSTQYTLASQVYYNSSYNFSQQLRLIAIYSYIVVAHFFSWIDL